MPSARPGDTPDVWQRIWLGLILASSLLILALALVPITDTDVGLWGQIARNAVESGEWLTLRYRGWIVDKPPLSLWLMALSLWAMGENTVALRGWQLLMVLLLALITYRTARLHAGREESLLAALLLLTFSQVLAQSLSPGQDVAITLFLALAFYEWLHYRRSARPVAAAWVGCWVALAVLTKGPVGLATFVLVAGADVVVARLAQAPDRAWRWTHALWGAATFTAVAAPWFVVGYLRQGFAFVDAFLIRGATGFGRFFRPNLGVLPLWQALLAYVPMLALGMLPWTGILPATVRKGWDSLKGGPPPLRLCALWAGAYFLLISLSLTDKVWRYLLPVYPPLAVVGAHALMASFSDPHGLRVPALVTTVMGLPVLAGGMWMLAAQFPQEVRIYLPLLLPFATALALSVLAFAVAATWIGGRAAVALLAAGTVLSFGLLTWSIGAHWERLWPWRTVAATVHSRYMPGDTVVVFRDKLDLPGYVVRVPLTQVDDEAVLARTWRAGRVFVLLRVSDLVLLPVPPAYRTLVTMPAGWALVINE